MKIKSIALVLLIIIDVFLLYLCINKDRLICEMKDEMVLCKNNENDFYAAYYNQLKLDAYIRTDLFYTDINSIMDMNEINCREKLYLLVLIPNNACWSCIEDEMKNVIDMGYNTIFMCSPNMENGLKILKNENSKIIIDIKQSKVLSENNFSIPIYVKLDKGEIGNVYIPIGGTQLNYIEGFMNN